MQGQVFAFALIILGLYIAYNVLFHGQQVKEKVQKDKSTEIFHIGCYDINRPLSHSTEIFNQLLLLAKQMNYTSQSNFRNVTHSVQSYIVQQNGGNLIAREFQNYITSYQNIKSRNQYEQSFFSTLKQTKDQFIDCREKFNQRPWECRQVQAQYNQTTNIFESLKLNLSILMSRKGDHIQRYNQLLKDEDLANDIEYTGRYERQIEHLNNLFSQLQQNIKRNNQTLQIIIRMIYDYKVSLNTTINILHDCETNKKQIDFCKNISDYVKRLHNGIDLKEMEESMKKKKIIIQLYREHLMRSKKLGENIEETEIQLEEAMSQLKEEQMLFQETKNSGKCGIELQFRCSDGNINELRYNVTLINLEQEKLRYNESSLRDQIKKDIEERERISKNITSLNEQMKNNVIDMEHIRLKESKKKSQLNTYRNTLNDIFISIGLLNKNLTEIRHQRGEESKKIDQLMARGEELINCLAKKDLYTKLDGKKPKYSQEDKLFKSRSIQSLVKVVNNTYKK